MPKALFQSIVLLIDDDQDTLEIFSQFLKKHVMKVLAATSGQAAFHTLGSERVDLVVLDLLMPEMDGIMVLHQMRKNSKTAETPVIVATVWDDQNAFAEAKRLGVKEYLIKPVLRRQLLRSVRTHLR